ncbi:MAG: Hpt domain-containing protein [Gammaproteobacteria bacterium]|nr:Hpt domain-containing protein [Gammaproteobacteria bacterium]NND38202.1 response regulator [Pseudomonadales bacterium]NNL10195.1 response regulator [Pseudomonadales bacterium]NNM12426.1 response regulator [Pseudomonadales bacterium]
MINFILRPIRAILNAQSAKFRIALGQASIIVSLMLVAAFAGLVPDRTGAILEGRAAMAEAIAANSSVFITRSDLRRVEANLNLIVQRNPDLLSAGVRNASGKILADVANHKMHWEPIEANTSTQTQLQVPILERGKLWGSIELRFRPAAPIGDWSFFRQPLVVLIASIGGLSFFCFYLYLGIMLKHLDPSQAIPDRVRSALDTIAEGLLVLDAKQNIVLANSAFESLVDSEADALVGLRIADFEWQLENNESPAADEWPWYQAMQDATSRLGVIVKLPDQSDDGKTRTFMVNCSPVMADGEVAKGVLVSFDDITELEEKEVQLRLSMQMAEDANKAKSDFLANMSHEIRTPMNAILGFTEILKRGQGKTEEESIKYLNTISSSGEHLLGLINDILDLSKVEAGRMDMEIIDCELHKVIHEVTRIMQIKAQQKNISLEYCPRGSLPASIHSDPSRFRQMLTNLVGNAIKFTEEGGVRIVTRYQESPEGNSILVEVSDTGIGMTQEQADNVFNPFTQADTSISRRFGGTGLGLTISKKFVEALGGSISVRSKHGEGSTFILDIPTGDVSGVPLLSPSELLDEGSQSEEAANVNWEFPDSRVLVVDDGPENRELLQVVLGDLGLTIDTAENGLVGTEKVAANDYDIVLMDINMPVMDGMQAVGVLRERGYDKPVYALTANAMKGTEQECIGAGFTGYMAKPIVIDKLIALMVETLGATPAAAKPSAPAAMPVANGAASDVPAPEATALDPVRSKLLDSNDKFRPIVEKFVVRLGDQVEAFEQSWDAKDYGKLADLAHWLKGSGGSVGFDQFSAVAAELEVQAKAGNEVHCAELITEIRSKYERIDVSERSADQAAIAKASKPVRAAKAPAATLKSSLPTSNAKFCNIVRKFIERLDEQLDTLHLAVSKSDFNEIANLAHWLKGSAGSVGFAAFTEPAAELEQAAKACDSGDIAQRVAVIEDLRQRMVVPDPVGDEPGQQSA